MMLPMMLLMMLSMRLDDEFNDEDNSVEEVRDADVGGDDDYESMVAPRILTLIKIPFSVKNARGSC